MKDWIDGPGLVEWLESQGVDVEGWAERSDTVYKRLKDWREGAVANVYTVDEYLVKHFGLILPQVPDRLYVDRPARKQQVRVTEQQKAEAVAMRSAGVPTQEIAKRFGVSTGAVRVWCRKARGVARAA